MHKVIHEQISIVSGLLHKLVPVENWVCSILPHRFGK